MMRGALANVTLLVTLVACAGEQESILKNDSAAYSNLFASLSQSPSPTDSEAYRLLAASPSELDESTVKFCFSTADQCRNGTAAQTVKGVATTVGTIKAYQSQSYVKISPNLGFVIYAKTTTGQELVQSVKIIPKGGTQTSTNTTQTGTNNPPATNTSTPTTECYKAPDEFVCKTELEIARLTSEQRTQNGLGGVTYHVKHSYVSRLWSEAQAQRGSIGHDWFPSTWNAKFQQEFNESPNVHSENVAMSGCDSDPTSTARTFVDMWMNSSGHRANILNGSSRSVGVGVARTGGMCYATQNFGG